MRSNNPYRQIKSNIVHIIESEIEGIKNELNLAYLVQYVYKKSFHNLKRFFLIQIPKLVGCVAHSLLEKSAEML
jgi:hypothetical protein